MLSKFEIVRHWYKAKVVIFVDCQKEEVSVLLTYSGRIVPTDGYTPFLFLRTPELAEKWLSDRIEAFHALAVRHFA